MFDVTFPSSRLAPYPAMRPIESIILVLALTYTYHTHIIIHLPD